MKKAKPYIVAVFVLLSIWTALTVSIQRLKRPDMTETELFLSIHKSFFLQWTQ